MRIDKYLWCIRVFKTRSLAAANCKADKIWVNNEMTKASREIKVNDLIRVRKGPVHFSWRVVSFPTSRVGAKLVPVYALECTDPEELKKLELIRLRLQQDRPMGPGRPTKKERRDLDDFFSPEDLDELDLE